MVHPIIVRGRCGDIWLPAKASEAPGPSTDDDDDDDVRGASQKRAPRLPKRCPQRLHGSPEWAPRLAQVAPKGPQDGPKTAQECWPTSVFLRGLTKNTSHGCPIDDLRGLKRPREGPKSGPGGPERAPRRPQDGPGMMLSLIHI
eukprot:1166143-Pyramimonas_sp.AAC.1